MLLLSVNWEVIMQIRPLSKAAIDVLAKRMQARNPYSAGTLSHGIWEHQHYFELLWDSYDHYDWHELFEKYGLHEDFERGVILTDDLTVYASFTEFSASTVTIEAGTFPVGYTLDGATSASVYSYNSATTAAKLIPINDDQHTVTIPSGLYVSKVTFIGCTQNNDPKGHIVEFNGQSCSYQLTDRKAATYTEVIFEDLHIEGQFTFTVDYKSAVKILLEVNAGTDAVAVA